MSKFKAGDVAMVVLPGTGNKKAILNNGHTFEIGDIVEIRHAFDSAILSGTQICTVATDPSNRKQVRTNVLRSPHLQKIGEL